MAFTNKIILECWDGDDDGEIIMDYDDDSKSIGLVIKMLDATRRIAFFKHNLLEALEQLKITKEDNQ